MRKITVINIVFLMLMFVGTASAYTIDYDFVIDGNEFTSPVAGAIVETFDTDSLRWTWDGDYAVVKDSIQGQHAAPHGPTGPNTSNYVTVPKDSNIGAVSVTGLGGTYNYFGLWWGSVDGYNSLQFFLGGSSVASINGADIASPQFGSWTDPKYNLYVNLFDLPEFDSFKMISNGKAFEVDNIAIAKVPEPGTLLLLGTGLAGLALYRRRSMNK